MCRRWVERKTTRNNRRVEVFFFLLSSCERREDVDGRRHVDAIADPDRSRTWSSTAPETDGRALRVCAVMRSPPPPPCVYIGRSLFILHTHTIYNTTSFLLCYIVSLPSLSLWCVIYFPYRKKKSLFRPSNPLWWW